MCGRVEECWKHLTKCKNAPEKVTNEAKAELTSRVLAKADKHTNKENQSVPGTSFTYLNPTPFAPSAPLSTLSTPNLPYLQSLPSPLPGASSGLGISIGADDSRPMQRPRTEAYVPVTGEAVFYGETAPKEQWSSAKQAEWMADMCRLMIACNIAWWAVENPYWRYFFAKWVPDGLMPGRKQLSSRILDEEAEKVVNGMKLKLKGKHATGSCDGWKNIAKTSLIGSMINVEYTVSKLLTYLLSDGLNLIAAAVPAQHSRYIIETQNRRKLA
jgi:hypothetical protein